MPVGLRFLLLLAPWTLGILGVLSAPLLVSGGFAALSESAGTLAALAFTLAAYPAGLSTAHALWEPGEEVRRVAGTAVAAGLACGGLFVVVNYVAPPGGVSLPELRRLLADAWERATAAGPSIDAWLPFNELAFQYTRRVDAMVLPLLFGGVGAFLGYWTADHPRPPVARAAQWILGAFLLVTTYFAGENGWELIVLRAAGPVPFVGDLALIVPGALALGLGLAVVADLTGESRQEA